MKTLIFTLFLIIGTNSYASCGSSALANTLNGHVEDRTFTFSNTSSEEIEIKKLTKLSRVKEKFLISHSKERCRFYYDEVEVDTPNLDPDDTSTQLLNSSSCSLGNIMLIVNVKCKSSNKLAVHNFAFLDCSKEDLDLGDLSGHCE